MTGIFISYRRADSAPYAGRIYDHLSRKYDDVFMDVDTIRPGQDFVTVLENAVDQAEAVVVVIGPKWETITDETGSRRLEDPHDFVRIEVAHALRRDVLVIPALVGGARMPNADHLPEDLKPLARRNALQISDERFGYDISRLMGAIQPAPPAASLKIGYESKHAKSQASLELDGYRARAKRPPTEHTPIDRTKSGGAVRASIIGWALAAASFMSLSALPGMDNPADALPLVFVTLVASAGAATFGTALGFQRVSQHFLPRHRRNFTFLGGVIGGLAAVAVSIQALALTLLALGGVIWLVLTVRVASPGVGLGHIVMALASWGAGITLAIGLGILLGPGFFMLFPDVAPYVWSISLMAVLAAVGSWIGMWGTMRVLR